MDTKKCFKMLIAQVAMVVILFSSNVFSQGSPQTTEMSEEVRKEINEQVWEVFAEAYHNVEFSMFKSIQSSNMTRVTVDSRKVQNYESYMSEMERFFNSLKSRGDTLGIRFSFTERLESNGTAFESGYYEFSMKRKDESEFTIYGYGQFDVVLKKEDGVWKLEYDRDKSVRITIEEFESNEVVSYSN